MPGLRPAGAARHDAELPGLSAEGANGQVHAGLGNVQQVSRRVVSGVRESEAGAAAAVDDGEGGRVGGRIAVGIDIFGGRDCFQSGEVGVIGVCLWCGCVD